MSMHSMTASGWTLHMLDGRQAAARETELIALHNEIFGAGNSNSNSNSNSDPDFARRLRVWCRQPGFLLAEARHGGYPVGYACGMPLRPSTDWWRDLTAPLPATVTAEYPGRTFALTQLLVRASWRRQGIAAELHDLILDGRAEARATVKLPPGAAAAQSAFKNWGWTKVARGRGPGSAAPVCDILTRPLQSRTEGAPQRRT
jgi:GNAT superfamily N-acetyltransferase